MTHVTSFQRVLLIGDPGKLPAPVFGLAREWFVVAAEHELANTPQLFRDAHAVPLASEIDIEVYHDHADEIHAWAQDIVRIHGPFDRIIAPSEYTICIGAQLRDRFGVPGWNEDEAARVRDKGEMKRRMTSAGVPTAGFIDLAVTTDLACIEAWAAKRPGRLVFKPKNQAGSRGVQIFDRADALCAAVARMPRDLSSKHLVEDFVYGQLLHIDGLMRDGELRFLAASRYLAPCLSWLNDSQAMGSVLISNRQALDRIMQFTTDVLAALSLNDLTFHLEAFDDGDGLTFLEIAGRPGGAAIVPYLRSQYGIDLLEEMVRCDLGLPSCGHSRGAMELDQTPRNGGWIATSMPTAAACRVVGMRGLDALPSSVFLADLPAIGERFNMNGDEGKASGRFHVATGSEAETEEALRTIDERYQLMVEQFATTAATREWRE